MKKYTLVCAMLAAAIAASGCGKKPAPAPETTPADKTVVAAETEESVTAEETKEESSDDEKEYDYYKELEGLIYQFSSGVGGWGTSLRITPNGHFTGEFYDSNMGETGEGYENGTIYCCIFSGELSEPVKVDDYTFEADVISLTYDTANEKGEDHYIEDETMYIYAGPYGLSEGAHLKFYAPEKPYSEIPEEYKSWVWYHFWDNEPETLEDYGIFNETDETGFYVDHYAMGDIIDEGEILDEPTEFYTALKNAYENKKIPEEAALPGLPTLDSYYMPEPYESVTYENLQGSWVNEYREGGHNYKEILSITGEKGRIESYEDGVPSYAWNGTGTVTIEDRSARNLCPAVRINDDYDGSNICTIYIRWVKNDKFFDGGFLNEWKRAKNGEYDYLLDTVTMDNLQGVWYSEYVDSISFYQDVLVIEGDHGTLYEEANGEPTSYWNGEGTVSLESDDIGFGEIPELVIKYADGSGSAGVYITSVNEDVFYDPGIKRYWYRIREYSEPWYVYEDNYDGD